MTRHIRPDFPRAIVVRTAFSLMVALTVAGCQEKRVASNAASDTADEQILSDAPSNADDMQIVDSAPPGAELTKDVSQVSLQLTNVDGLLEHIATLKGQVVVLDIWSTSCVPCMQEFPNLVQLSRDASQQVKCISFNIDYFGSTKKPPETYIAQAESFLRQQEATLTNFLSTDVDEVVRERFGISAIPAVIVYGIDGQIARTFTDANASGSGVSYQLDVIPAVEALIARLEAGT
ncbi:MAG: TlpA family protein disulfide reductase [Planctomycetales bacterium]|nr:TlpA family protein disulfide reductase [Planctomycetales bacterium]